MSRRDNTGKLLTLKRIADFERLFSEGQRYRGKFMIVLWRSRREGSVRVAFLTSKSVGSAVRRNRQRRRLREAYRRLWPRMAKQPVDIGLMALPEAEKCAFSALCDELATLLARTGILPTNDVA
ncbi:MAG: ribonuclease P protein component [Candidatus Zipacnadales bacterium]